MAGPGLCHPFYTHPACDPPTLRQAVHWIGRLGGFLARRGDGEPGVTVLWKGFQHLTDLTTMDRIMIQRPAPRNEEMWVKHSPVGEGSGSETASQNADAHPPT